MMGQLEDGRHDGFDERSKLGALGLCGGALLEDASHLCAQRRVSDACAGWGWGRASAAPTSTLTLILAVGRLDCARARVAVGSLDCARARLARASLDCARARLAAVADLVMYTIC